ncbi:MAG TPA: glutamyl-tRNA amidotransferase [Rhodospirillaceae bacterium]|nr:glutamyl-tRNA amidotransferase [Rhodospirillaceae bacterium]MAX64311.1 glutamyl-tRNA amidotransferase [Rhodospirillaceae bacterium]MBB58225.1 glutamyl-tRNA amidotransferase [Rhodospirillaceae bacterium]HAE01256.1 glutamyl-tRNA amidotransferase [Rhodospirillaceae bacterium]HAJ19106.1 glutamyl-tRNA amidotransferase [Rhodospirillaceae bacterium]|tara:strand:- start:205 stop:657 length:453 start_codon:yes stop_codon:yes gene_type:complete
MRDALTQALKESMRAKDERAVSTLRLILAALKDRDIAARSKGNSTGITDDEVLQMLQSMVKQRRDSIAMYEQGGRLELAEREQQEIDIIQRYLPKQMTEDEIAQAVQDLIEEMNASGLKQMGAVMGELRERYAGQMDFAKASPIVKQKLA